MAARIVGERFALEALAGKGAMGAVYSARDLQTGERVAVKVLIGGRTTFPRFEREAEVLARLHHPRIVRYIGHGETREGEAFLAMEWLDGDSLQKRLQSTPLTPVESIDVARSIAEALVAAHAAGVVHRDLKPANVVLVGNAPDWLKVVDFGIARVSGGGPALTASGEIIGTPAYMSPEQARSSKDVDHRSDLFSLGCILYRCIAGVYPFAADGPLNILVRLTTERAAPLVSVVPSAPAGLSLLVDALLAPEPDERIQSAALVHAALSSLRGQLVDTASRVAPAVLPSSPRPAAAATVTSPARRQKSFGALYAALFGAGVLALAAVGGLWAFTLGPFASSTARRSKAKAVARDDACPEPALACEDVAIADPSHVDPLELLPTASAFGAKLGGGDVAEIKTDALTAAGVDLTGKATIEYHMSKGIYVQVKGTTLIALTGSAAKVKDPLRWGACGVREAYGAAAREGMSTEAPWGMRLADQGDGLGYTFWGPPHASMTRIVTIMATDCKPGATVIEQ